MAGRERANGEVIIPFELKLKTYPEGQNSAWPSETETHRSKE